MSYVGTVHAERYTDCPFSIAQTYAEAYLRDAQRGGQNAVIHAGPFRRRVSIVFESRADAIDPGRPHEEISLRWIAGTPLLPDFKGTLRMRISSPGTLLVLDGQHVPPGGAAGALFDRLIGRRIASATASGLLAHLAQALAERERMWRDAS